jgi:hypothetical protein
MDMILQQLYGSNLSERKGVGMIQKLNLNYTESMEKSLQQSHGLSYREYELSHEKRLEIEKKRDEDYQKAKDLS